MLTFRFIDDEEDLKTAVQVLIELRPGLSSNQIAKQVIRQKQDGFQLLAAFQVAQCVAVAGFWINEKLAWGKHLYIDDLVTAATVRGQKIGAQLLGECISIARQQGCQSLHLDSGVQRLDAHRFYKTQGMHISSHHFALSLET